MSGIRWVVQFFQPLLPREREAVPNCICGEARSALVTLLLGNILLNDIATGMMPRPRLRVSGALWYEAAGTNAGARDTGPAEGASGDAP